MMSFFVLLTFGMLHGLQKASSLKYPSSNGDLYVSVTGADDAFCGNEMTHPCQSISSVCTQGSNPRQVIASNGTYMETESVIVEGTLTIVGSSSSDCYLTKSNDTSFTLFILKGQSAQLSLANLTVLLTNDANGNIIGAGTSHNVVVRECRITMGNGDGEHTPLENGIAFLLLKDATLKIELCLVVNITAKNAIIYVDGEGVTLSISETSFVNIATSGNGGGGCFYLEKALKISLVRSVFIKCSSSSGGIGYIKNLFGMESTIESCSFLNGTSFNNGGVLVIGKIQFALTIINSSYSFCGANTGAANTGGGGVLFLELEGSSNIKLIDCSFTFCFGFNGGVVNMATDSYINIKRCTFIRCTFIECKASGKGGVLFSDGIGTEVNITGSVYLGNVAVSGGNDNYFSYGTSFSFEHTFTDKGDASQSSWCSPLGDCGNLAALLTEADYDSATCSGSFTVESLKDECQMFCAKLPNSGTIEESVAGAENDADNNTSTNDTDNNTSHGTDTDSDNESPAFCLKADACPSGFAVLANGCASTCFFWEPNEADGSCRPPCIVDSSLGYRLCTLRDCAARMPYDTYTHTHTTNVDTGGRFPCGSADCYQQVSNGGTGVGVLNATCGVSCDSAHFTASAERGVCVLKDCAARSSVSSLQFPCGTVDCHQQTNKDGTYSGKCEDLQSERSDNGILLTTIVIIIIVVVVGALVAVGIPILVVVVRRKRKKSLGDDTDHCLKNNEMELQNQKKLEVIPTHIKDYTVINLLGRGACGVVYKVSKDNDIFVIKSILMENAAGGERSFTRMFSKKCSECKFLVKYFEEFRDKEHGQCFVVEYCDHGDLDKWMKKIKGSAAGAQLDQRRIIKVLIQVLLGLDVLHRQHVVHHDIKGANIFVDEEDNVKLADLGSMEMLVWEYVEGYQFGKSIAFTAPEVLKKTHKYSFSSDMWSVGVLLYQLYEFKLPFDNQKEIEIGKYPKIHELRISSEMDEVITSLLDMDPDKRPSASSLLQLPFIRQYAEEFDLLQFYPDTIRQ